MSTMSAVRASTLVLALGASGCRCAGPPRSDAWTFTPDEPPSGDAARGAGLVRTFECNRCHDATGAQPVARDRHCVHCHQAVALAAGKPVASPAGKVTDFPAATIARWERNIPYLRDVPSLEGVGKRYRRKFVESFLLRPHDLRPNLNASMPRLALTEADARDLATYLVPDAAPAFTLAGANAARGKKLAEDKSCGACHASSGDPLALAPAPGDPRDLDRTITLAPDLRHAREKWRPDALVAWLVDPRSVKADAVMPAPGLTEAEAKDVALWLLSGERSPEALPEPPKRLPPLERPVAWAEVEKRVFRRTCWHCHSDPEMAFGDGGPGNSGGLGFKGIRLDLATYGGIQSGALGPDGQRRSVFAPLDARGTPRLVAALWARHEEVAGRVDPAIRGMPLALPPLPAEEIQLVETWIAQGRPQ